MGFFDIWRNTKPITVAAGNNAGVSRPVQMQFRFLENGQVIWFADNQEELLKNGFLDNHVVFTLADYKAKKVASVPWILSEVKSKTLHKRYKALLKEATPASFDMALRIKKEALEEVENEDIMKIFETPNPYMSYEEFAYGTSIYKDFVGCSYWDAVRGGSVNDPTIGKIRELYLPFAHQRRIKSGGLSRPIAGYYSINNPDITIDASNVYQMRNFSPRNEDATGTQSLYGLPRIYAGRKLLQKYNEGIKTEADILQKKGQRHIVHPKNLHENQDVSYTSMAKARDGWEQKLNEAGPGGIAINNTELGVITVGFTPKDLGILESSKADKEDFCAMWNLNPMLFGWASNTTYTNFPEARKMAITDAIIPELEAMKHGFNKFYLPSHDASGKYSIDYDLEFFSEMQADMKSTVEWMTNAGVYTPNEIRAATRYGVAKDENADKIIVKSGLKLLENIGTESFAGDLDMVDEVIDDEDKINQNEN